MDIIHITSSSLQAKKDMGALAAGASPALLKSPSSGNGYVSLLAPSEGSSTMDRLLLEGTARVKGAQSGQATDSP